MKPLQNEVIDLTACIPQGKTFQIDGKEYTIIFNYKTIYHLEEMYESMEQAIEELNKKEHIYQTVINFLYAALVDEYKITKQEIELWLGEGTIIIFRNLIFSALVMGYGSGMSTGEDDTQPNDEGEA